VKLYIYIYTHTHTLLIIEHNGLSHRKMMVCAYRY